MTHESDDELWHLELAARLLGSHPDPVRWIEGDPKVIHPPGPNWRRACIAGDWAKKLPLYLWIAV